MIDNYSWITVYPEIVLLTLACVIALVDLGVTTRLRNLTYVMTMGTLAVVAWFTAEFALQGRREALTQLRQAGFHAGCRPEELGRILDPPARDGVDVEPLLVGGNDEALALSAKLTAAGLLVPAIRPPTVPQGTARLRISLSADHQPADVAQLVETLVAAA